MELQPILSDDGRVTGLVGASSEFVVVRREEQRVFLWMDDYGVDITPLARDGVIRVSQYEIRLWEWLDITPAPGGYTLDDLDEYVRIIASAVRDKLENRRLLLSFSGGKDSTACLVILSRLEDYVRFDLRVAYSHMVYLEPEANIERAERIASKLGYELEVTSPPEWVVRRYLRREGLPYRGARWCTYLKTRPLRELRKALRVDYEVVGDRLSECGKRFSRLIEDAVRRRFLSEGQLRPALFLQLLDVVRIVRERDVVHPHYLRGCTRVACTYCPYKSLYELRVSEETGWEDLIESVLRDEYRRWYERRGVSAEEFERYHLWRYKPIVAKMFSALRESVSRLELEEIGLSEVQEMFSSVWTKPLPRLRAVGLEAFIEFLRSVSTAQAPSEALAPLLGPRERGRAPHDER